ncbi:MAG: UDP-N-acetylmuramate dehydrogenase [Oscillospiraceae bacterium]|nr:UDP-N-acetylmuramate dehydrogenase [Oscillospiraceae bacterium]
MTDFQKKITENLPEITLRLHEPMAKHTSFRIGGPAHVMAFPKNESELAQILQVSDLLDIDWVILGAGTNVLAPDEGLDRLVICLKDCMDGIEQLDDTTIRVAAGVTMTRAAVFAANLGLSGMEFAHGIPGTVGGGVYMNAGAYGGEIKDICTAVSVMDRKGNIRRVSGEQMGFSYRHSILEETGQIVVAAEFTLEKADAAAVKERMQELAEKRRASQPLNLPSAGSAFKRPAGGYAAALIDQNGLKGFQVGGAAISEKHAGFVVNLGGASAQDVKTLLTQVSDRVFENTGIRLEPEVRIW